VLIRLAVPNEIPGVGKATLRVRLNPEFDLMGARGLTSESYYVLSRVDGRASLHDLILMTGFPIARAIEILTQLRSLGALLLPGETPEQMRAAGAVPDTAPVAPDASSSGTVVLELDETTLSDEERAALEADVALAPADRRRVLVMLRRLRTGDYYAVLGVEPGTDRRTVKRAYFKLSKEFHPDRYYGKPVGPFGDWLARVFHACSVAYETLTDPQRRTEYEAARAGKAPAGSKRQPQTREEHAAQLFEQACALEVRGDVSDALRLLAAVVRQDPQHKYLRRAARCALHAGDLGAATEYAKKAVELAKNDPSAHRLLADVHRAAGALDSAEDVLQRALSLKSENDVLLAELQEDLSAVRKLRGSR